jgi:hypothetical protein
VAALALLLTVAAPVFAETKDHRAAAEELLELLNTGKLMQDNLDAILAAQLKATPQLEPVQEELKTFLTRYISYPALKEGLVAIYTSEFTEAELREMTAFYRTPTGRKMVAKLPRLMQKSSELGLKRVQDNQGELKQRIEEALKKKAKP